MNRVYNFSAGPSMLPLPVLEKAQSELVCYGDTGMSVMEMSHRSKMYEGIIAKAEADLRTLMHIPENYKVLFLQGGASMQFAQVPLNLLSGYKTGKADYINSGNFANLAMKEAKRYGDIKEVASSKDIGYTQIPDWDEKEFRPDADYFYICGNNTIYGTRYTKLPETGKVPLVADLSSSILSQEYDVTKFGIIFAGAQKNIGPAGVTIVIIRDDLLGHALDITPVMLNYQTMADKGSMYNTPPTYGIYMAGLTFDYLLVSGRRCGDGKAQYRKGEDSLRLSGREQAVPQPGASLRPLADERHLRHRRRGQGRGVRQGGDRGRFRQPERTPLGRRHARLHLQRHAG